MQRLVWPRGQNIPVTAYLWGAGGGGGGNDSRAGGAGSAGGYAEINFTVSEGDVIEVAVGGGGGAGATTPGVGGSPGGTGGASTTSATGFDTRSAATSPPVIAYSNSAYVGFLNQYGVWVNPVSARDFDRSYVVNFPVTANYTFIASCDNFGTIYLDGVPILDVPGFQATYSTTLGISPGLRTVRIIGVNTGGPGAVALTITGGLAYSGGGGGGTGGYQRGSGGAGGSSVGGSGGTQAGDGSARSGSNGVTNRGGGGGGASGGNQVNISSVFGGNGGSGVVVLEYPTNLTITIGAGLTGTTATVGSNRVTTITAGTGNVSWT